MPPRWIFGCGCPIYARLLVRHPDPNIAPFEFNGSLAKLGVREKLAAEELIDQWTVQFLSGQTGKPDPNIFKTVERAIEDYLAEKRGTLDAHKESTKLTIQKIAGILRPLAPFLRDRGRNCSANSLQLEAISYKSIYNNKIWWRRKRDSNPRASHPANGFQDRRLQPLGHSSIHDLT